MEKIKFLAEDGESMEWYVLEQTTVGGINYILVTDAEEGDAEALILKDFLLVYKNKFAVHII